MTREEAIKWLKNEKWKNANNTYKKEWNEAFELAIEALSVVRCKDCRHFIHYADGCGVCNEKNNILTYQNQNDFCSYGERKGGDDE